MKKIKIISVVLLIAAFISLLTACGNKASSVSEDQQQKYTALAEKVIDDLNKNKLDSILVISTDEMKNVLSKDKFAEVYKAIESNGAFKEFEKSEVETIEQDNCSFIVVIEKVKYEKKSLTYTISFDKDDKLAGLYFK